MTWLLRALARGSIAGFVMVWGCSGSSSGGFFDGGADGASSGGAAGGGAGGTAGAGTGGAATGGTAGSGTGGSGGAATGGVGGGGSCETSLDCAPGLVCDPSAHQCVECNADADCTGGLHCSGHRCAPTCDSDLDCTPLGLVCDFSAGYCAPPGGSGGAGGGGGTGGVGGAGGGVGGAGGGVGGTGGTAPCRADFLWAVDNSCSMTDDWPEVQATFGAFEAALSSSGLDAHVALIVDASSPGLTLCADPPLGTGNCATPGGDSVPPSFIHLPSTAIGSTTELAVILSAFSQYSPAFRPGVQKFIVHVSDDELGASPTVSEFISQFDALDPSNHLPGGQRAWTFSARYPFTLCPSAVELGVRMNDLVTTTGGIAGDLCTSSSSVFVGELIQHVRVRTGCEV